MAPGSKDPTIHPFYFPQIHAVQVSESSSCSSYTTASSCIISPSSILSTQTAVCCLYKTTLSTGEHHLITVTWYRNATTQGLKINSGDDSTTAFRLNTHSGLFRKKRGSKSFEINDSKFEVYYDLSSAQYDAGAEPVEGEIDGSENASNDDRSLMRHPSNGSLEGSIRRKPSEYTTATSSPSAQITNMEPKTLTNARWRRVVFKISGAALTGSGSQNIDPKVAVLIAREVSLACNIGVEVAIVVGGRNFFCRDIWVTENGLDRSTAYRIGMMSTVMNSILLQSTLEKLGVQARVQSAFCMPEVSAPYNKHRAIRHLEKGRVVIFCVTGNPLLSTDTAAALRASEANNLLFKCI